MRVGETAKVKLIPETCCEICQEVVHNHFDRCPACHEEFAPTDRYSDILEDIIDWPANPVVLKCESCKARFLVLEPECKRYYIFVGIAVERIA